MSKKKDFIEFTKETWQPYYEEFLTDKDAVEIHSNMTNFMRLLESWARAESMCLDAQLTLITNSEKNLKESLDVKKIQIESNQNQGVI
jgi:glutaredoxin-related protein